MDTAQATPKEMKLPAASFGVCNPRIAFGCAKSSRIKNQSHGKPESKPSDNQPPPLGITETFQPKSKSFGNSILSPLLPGEHDDTETGHHYNNMRDNSPELGRYLQADPSGLNGVMNFHMPMSEVIQ